MSGQDFSVVIYWWLLLFILGVVNFPATWLLLRRFFDAGYGFAKTIGIVILTYVVFVGATIHLIPITRPSLFLVFLLTAGLNFLIFKKHKEKILNSLVNKKKILIFQEVFFFSGLLFWSYVRSHQPDIEGLEKFMDYGFINSIIRTKFLPPPDMWFAGNNINYYWFGHLWAALTTKLSGIAPGLTYNLLLGTILGFILTGVFSLVTSLFKFLGNEKLAKLGIAAGIISAILVVFAGNFHAPFYVLKNGAKNYWYPDATRFIGYNPDTEDKTIHEFPQYSFVVSDLHAHVLDIQFVILFLALLANYVLVKKEKPTNFKEELLQLAPLGFMLGVMFSTSSWDFAVYSMVTGITIGFFNLYRFRLGLDFVWETLKKVGLIVILGLGTALPFLLNFDSLAQGIGFVKFRSPLWQLAILWGFPAVFTAIFLLFLYFRGKKNKVDFFILSLLISSWLLIIIPEFIYVKDIYVSSYSRANTMFKLVYQAFIMFYISVGYIAARTLSKLERESTRGLSSLFYALLFFSVLIYPYYAIKSYYGDLKISRGLSGESWLAQRYPDEYQAILWFRENVKGQPVILEAVGDSYTTFNVVSAYTGLPTIEGWLVHEWLWRGSFDEPGLRGGEVDSIYSTSDVNFASDLLKKYTVAYVIVGNMEREKYPNLSEAKFNKLGEVVFTSGNLRLYKLTNSSGSQLPPSNTQSTQP